MNSEERFIIKIVNIFIGLNGEELEEEELINLNWGDVIFLSTCHRVLPIVAKIILESNIAYVLNSNILKLLKCVLNENIENDKKKVNEAKQLSNILYKNNINGMLIKGPINSIVLYPGLGYRTYEDIDILVNKADLQKLKKILVDNNYRQGKIDFNTQKFIEANRKDIIHKELCTHETIEFYKFENDNLTDIMIDINHSLSWKGHDSYLGYPSFTVDKLLNNKKIMKDNEIIIRPSNEDLFLYIVVHLYNEAIFFCWQICWEYNYGDIQLIKFIDVILAMKNEMDWEKVDKLIAEYNIREPVEYTLTCIFELFGNNVIPNSMRKYISKIEEIDFYYDIEGNKHYWEMSFKNRVFEPKKRVNEIRMKKEGNV